MSNIKKKKESIMYVMSSPFSIYEQSICVEISGSTKKMLFSEFLAEQFRQLQMYRWHHKWNKTQRKHLIPSDDKGDSLWNSQPSQLRL